MMPDSGAGDLAHQVDRVQDDVALSNESEQLLHGTTQQRRVKTDRADEANRRVAGPKLTSLLCIELICLSSLGCRGIT